MNRWLEDYAYRVVIGMLGLRAECWSGAETGLLTPLRQRLRAATTGLTGAAAK